MPGVAAEHERSLNFAASNALEALSPSNFLATNPELLDTTRAEAGQNLVRGFKNWLEDVERTLGSKGAAGAGKFVVGKDIAATPGKVVMRNALAELIQYGPATDKVFAEPILIVPAWIMKYYILDLSAKNSMVKYLVSQGHTVFIVSWKNPSASDRELGMDDYLRLGVRDMVDAVSQIVPGQKIHTVGYCIGGTLLSIAAAAYAAEGDQRLASVTLLAAQQDFSEPGELVGVHQPEPARHARGGHGAHRRTLERSDGAAFTLLRSRDLLWTPAVNTYVRGKRESPNDLMAWNADGTRMPSCMHAQYLRQLYLNNELARGEFRVGRAARRTLEDSAADVRRRHRDGPRRAVAVGIQGARTHALRGLHLSADLRRSQCRHRQRAGAPAAAPPSAHVVERRRDAGAADLARDDTARSGLLVAGLGALARAAFDCRSASTPPQFGAAAAGYPPIADAPGEYVLQK